MARTFPSATLAVALAAITATCIPMAGYWLLYDRAAIGSGEIWRIVTGHLYHYSWLHLACNLLPFVLVGAWIETQIGPCFAVGSFLMAATIGISLLVFQPNMARYGGLSGIDCGLMAYFGLWWLRIRGRKRTVGCMALGVLLLKIGYECYVGDALLAKRDGQEFVVVPVSHVVGCLSAWLFALTHGKFKRDVESAEK